MTKNLKEKLKNLGKNRDISLHEYIETCLYDPEFGYYQKNNPFGSKGDFVTAPEISQVFGEVIGCYIAYIWQENNKPKNFKIIEFGAGNASLMSDILRATKNINKFEVLRKNSIRF